MTPNTPSHNEEVELKKWLKTDLAKQVAPWELSVFDYFSTSQTSLLQTAIDAVEDMKMKCICGHTIFNEACLCCEVAFDYNEALSKVVELLKGGIEII